MRTILATYALPYANGQIHLGHMLGFIQTDIFCRFQRMQGHACYFICGSDQHGTPIMLKAAERKIDPATMVKDIASDHLKDFNSFHIQFDAFHATHTPENQKLVYDLYAKLKSSGDIAQKMITQSYDPEAQMFLPDRYVKGTCPRCKAENQYGDSCEACGATYSPADLINPISTISGKTPIQKECEHFFFKLTHYTGRLATWMHSGSLQKEVEHKLREWLDQGLQDWDISRDAPYFGFEIPDAPGKYFYVWLDAPVGYLASFQTLCDRLGLSFQDFWKSESKTELYHFIGKDIMYFHALFWPAVLMSAQYRLPNGVFVHGFVTVNGQKMSKSRGTFITARRYLKHLNPEYLRYYFATKLSGSIEDIDLQLDDFSARVNSDLVGKVVNIASRCAGFIRKSFNNTLSETLLNPALFEEFLSKTHEIKTLYETREYGRAMREIMALADKANQFIELHQPWTLAKTPGQELMTQQVCTQGLNCFRHLIILLKPVLPQLAEEAQAFLNVPDLKWADLTTPLLNHTICDFKPLMTRIDPAQLTALQNDEDSA